MASAPLPLPVASSRSVGAPSYRGQSARAHHASLPSPRTKSWPARRGAAQAKSSWGRSRFWRKELVAARGGRWASAGERRRGGRGGAMAHGESRIRGGQLKGAMTGLQITHPSLNSGRRFWRFGEDTGNSSFFWNPIYPGSLCPGFCRGKIRHCSACVCSAQLGEIRKLAPAVSVRLQDCELANRTGRVSQ